MKDRNSSQNEKGLLPFEMIRAANEGDLDAIVSVIVHYESYIRMQARRYYTKPNGQSEYATDDEIYDELVMKLIDAILSFDMHVR